MEELISSKSRVSGGGAWEGGDERRDQGHARGGTVLGDRSGRNVQVDVVRVEVVRRQAQLLGTTASVGDRRACRFLHDVSELTGKGEPSSAGNHCGFNSQHVSADGSPGEAGRCAKRALLFDLGLLKATRAKRLL